MARPLPAKPSVLASALALLLTACPGSAQKQKQTPAVVDAGRPPSTDPSAQDYVAPPLPRGKVVLEDAFGARHVVDVEIAATAESRARGLMWRTSLDAGKGMLFVFPVEDHLGFWMKNTLIPLDMIFIGADRRIVGIVKNAEPKTLTSRSVGRPSKYVLEVPGGWSDRIGLKVGAVVQLEGVPMLPSAP